MMPLKKKEKSSKQSRVLDRVHVGVTDVQMGVGYYSLYGSYHITNFDFAEDTAGRLHKYLIVNCVYYFKIFPNIYFINK